MTRATDRESGRVDPPPGTRGVTSHRDLPVGLLIGRRVRALREGRGWRQLDLARRLALVGLPWTQAAVATVESGDRQLVLEELVAFARVFGLPIAELLPVTNEGERFPSVRIGSDGLLLPAFRWYLSGGHQGNRDDDHQRKSLDRDDFDTEYADTLLEHEETVRKAAGRLGVDRQTVQRVALELWAMSLPRRRDADLADQLREQGLTKVAIRSRQALRGHITRRLLAQMRAAIAKENQ